MDSSMTVAAPGKELIFENILMAALQLPGVKVDRNQFLSEMFANESVSLDEIVNLGPIACQIPQDRLTAMANKLILKRTSQSSIASFATGIPGGLAMAATIPADVLQFFGTTLRLAQELSYLYGADNLWQNGQLDNNQVKDYMLLYCGVMFGISGAVSGVRVLSAQVAKAALKKLPQKALTKTFWYPILKKLGTMIGLKITKSSFAKGVSKVIPVVGGIVSGGLNFASMKPMATRLQLALDSAAFGYTETDFEEDLHIIESMAEEPEAAETPDVSTSEAQPSRKKLTAKFSTLLKRRKNRNDTAGEQDIVELLEKLSKLKEAGVLTEEEFNQKKAELLSRT